MSRVSVLSAIFHVPACHPVYALGERISDESAGLELGFKGMIAVEGDVFLVVIPDHSLPVPNDGPGIIHCPDNGGRRLA